jgi:flavin-binding protein dodecin
VSKSASKSSVYRVTEIIGTSESSWEDAAKHAVETATKTLRDLRVAESEQTRFGDRGRQSHRFPRAGESIVQVRRQRIGIAGEEGEGLFSIGASMFYHL